MVEGVSPCEGRRPEHKALVDGAARDEGPVLPIVMIDLDTTRNRLAVCHSTVSQTDRVLRR